MRRARGEGVASPPPSRRARGLRLLDAWAATLARSLDDGDALTALAHLVAAASQATTLADAMPTLVRARALTGCRSLAQHLQRLFGAPGAAWKPAQTRAFEAFAAAATEHPNVALATPLLQHFDRLTGPQQHALVA